MEVTMNIAGVKAKQPVRKSAIDKAAEKAIMNNVVLNQKLNMALDAKNKVLADKAMSDSLLARAKNDLAAAYRTIFELKTRVAELTESLNAALSSKRQKKTKPADVDATEAGVAAE